MSDPRRISGSLSPGEVPSGLPGTVAERLARLTGMHRDAVAAAAVALAGRRAEGPAPADRVFLWVTLERGCEQADRAYWATACDRGGALASPRGFVATLPSSVAGGVALALGLTGPVVATAANGPAGEGERTPPEAVAIALDSGFVLLHLFIEAGPDESEAGATVHHDVWWQPGGGDVNTADETPSDD